MPINKWVIKNNCSQSEYTFKKKKIMEKEIYRRDLEHPPKKNSKKKYPVFQISSL